MQYENLPEKDRVRIQHMLDYAREAISLTKDVTKQELAGNRVLTLAVIRLIEIVGEAAAQVSKPTRQKSPRIPWQQIVGMRNRLIHGYDAIDSEILWQTLQTDLPSLIFQLESEFS